MNTFTLGIPCNINAGFSKTGFWLVLFTLVFALFVIYQFQLDLVLADYLYRQQGEQWALKHDARIKFIYHLQNGFARASGALLIILLIGSYFSERLKPFKYPLLYATLAITCSLLLVNLLKKTTGLPCPYDIQRYQGAVVYANFVDLFKTGETHQGRCFPSGHASGGYVYLCFYFFFLMVNPKLRFYGLASGLLLGCSFGVIQMLRGAHFLSHDIFSLMIVWMISYAFFQLFRRRLVYRANQDGIFDYGDPMNPSVQTCLFPNADPFPKHTTKPGHQY